MVRLRRIEREREREKERQKRYAETQKNGSLNKERIRKETEKKYILRLRN